MNAVIYARYSSHAQNEQSIEVQLDECRKYADSLGYDVINEYCDKAMSARTDDRTAFQQMIKDSSSHKFEAVIVYKLDRFARNRYDSAIYKTKLKKNGVKVFSALEMISDSPEGIILEGMLEAFAEYYSANLSQNVKKGMKKSVEKLQWNNGQAPIGYDVVDRKLVPSESSSIVTYVFNEYAKGTSISTMMHKLNELGYKTA